MKRNIFIILLTSVLASAAFADQCAVVDKAQAKAFTDIVKVGDFIGTLCEPCGELPTELGGPMFYEVTSIEIKPFVIPGIDLGNIDPYQVVINGDVVDLAYTYISTAQSEFYTVTINAAYFVGCDATGVSSRFFVGE